MPWALVKYRLVNACAACSGYVGPCTAEAAQVLTGSARFSPDVAGRAD
jgi:hypothetical protein